ncbi:MAG: hypothetical protein PHH60_01975 [Candidatus Margulisbacteria bacterium]|nr:hypothetical protein [Candidatus Margulisiibacteriota bacterium]
MLRINTKGLTIWGRLGVRLCPILTARSPYTKTETLNVLAAARELGELSLVRKGSPASIDKLRRAILEHKNSSPAAVMGAWGEIAYDDLTGSIMGKIGTRNYDKGVAGLLNLKTGQMYLMEECQHDLLADLAGLEAEGGKLKTDWYGFSLTSLGGVQIKVSPMSADFGRIPIKLAPLFEAYVKHIFGGRMQGRIMFYQFSYERNIPPDKLAALANFSNCLVPASQPDEDLLKAQPPR